MPLYEPKIDKDILNDLPPCDIKGRIVVVDSPSQVDEAVGDLMGCALIGFDTETKPSFTKGVQHTVSLLQLATDTTAYLFRLKMIGQNRTLKRFLENDRVMKVGLSVTDDFRSLNKWMECRPRQFVELQRYVKAFGIEEEGLQKIYALVFGRKMSKRQQLSNWESPVLTPAQQLYAATDAWACRDIYYELRTQIDKIGK